MSFREQWDDNAFDGEQDYSSLWTPEDAAQYGDDSYYQDLILEDSTPAAIHTELLDIIKNELGFTQAVAKGSSVAKAWADENELYHPGANDIDIVVNARSLDNFDRSNPINDDQILQAAKNRITLSEDFELIGEAARFTKTGEGYSVASFTLKYHGHEIDINLVTCDVSPDCVLEPGAPVWGIVTDGENVFAHPDFQDHYRHRLFVPCVEGHELEKIKARFAKKNLAERFGWTYIDPTPREVANDRIVAHQQPIALAA